MSKTDKKKTIVGGSQTPPIVNDKVTVATPQPTETTQATQEAPAQPVQPTQPAVTQTAPTAPAQPQTTPTITPVTADVAQPAVQPLPINQATPPATMPTAPNPNLLPTNQVAQQPPTSVPTPQYADKVYTTSSDVDARNQQLSGQVDKPVQTESEEPQVAPTTTIYATDKDGQVIYDEQGNPTPLDLQPQTGASDDVRALSTEPQTAESEQDGGGLEFKGKRYNNYTELLSDISPQTSDEDKAKQMRHERRNALISAIGDGLAALSNLYFTTKGAPDQGIRPGMTEAAKKRMDDLRAKWQAEKDKYEALMLKGIEMDQAQSNFNTTYAQKEREQQFRYQKYLETERPQALAKIEQIKEQIIKLKDDNEMNAATKDKRLEKLQKELDFAINDLNFKDDHDGLGKAEYAKFKADEKDRKEKNRIAWANHNESVRYHNQQLKNKDGEYQVISAQGNYMFKPSKKQINTAYAYLLSRGKVDAGAKTPEDKLNAIQLYYSNDLATSARGRTRYTDKEGSKVDAMLGGSVDMESGEFNY